MIAPATSSPRSPPGGRRPLPSSSWITSSTRSPSRRQRLQTDNGTEFMAYKVRDELFDMRIKHRPIQHRPIQHRPIPPRTPHLNGKIERVQQTMLTEFYATTTFDS